MEAALKQISNFVGRYVNLETPIQFISDHKVVIIASSSVILYGLYFLRRPKNLPPGPYGFPIIGSVAEFNNMEENLNRLREKYGDIFTLWLGGNNYTVIMNSLDVIKEAYVNKGTEFANRTEMKILNNDTIFNTEYNDTYKVSRKTASQVLRKLLSTKFDHIYDAEMTKAEEYFDGIEGPLDLFDTINHVFTNVATKLLVNKTYAFDDKDLVTFENDALHWVNLAVEMVSYEVFQGGPLRGIIKLLTMNKVKEAEHMTNQVLRIFYDRIDELQSSDERSSEPRDVTEAYLNTGQFTADQIASTVFMLFPDFLHTSGIMCRWLFVYLLNYPKYQEMIQQEIDEVVGTNPMSVTYRPKMPITESFIVEVLRINPPFSIGVSNQPKKDTTLLGYNIPKYVNVAPNYYAVNHDPQHFAEPNLFKPERFIQDGRIGKMEAFITFGLGRRMCVGESVVRNNLFLFLTSMIQRYQISSGSGNPPSLDKVGDSVFTKPQPFTVILKKRNA